jgi:hypothetical protein
VIDEETFFERMDYLNEHNELLGNPASGPGGAAGARDGDESRLSVLNALQGIIHTAEDAL